MMRNLLKSPTHLLHSLFKTKSKMEPESSIDKDILTNLAASMTKATVLLHRQNSQAIIQ